jgi:hypothetical protein
MTICRITGYVIHSRCLQGIPVIARVGCEGSDGGFSCDR